MFLQELEVRNFKCFESLHVNLDNFNVLIGANASGKSNFIRILKFLRNIVQYNLQDAISMEGGVEYLRNINIGNRENLYIRLKYNPNTAFVREMENGLGLIGIRMPEAVYEFELSFYKRGKGFRISKDQLVIFYKFMSLKKNNDNQLEDDEELGSGKAVYQLVRKNLKVKFDVPKDLHIKEDRLSPLSGLSQIGGPFPEKTIFLETPFFGLAVTSQ